jgi:hypothetical protein
MVQAGWTHQVIADHFNVSRISISRLIIHLQQTGRTNDRPCNGLDRPCNDRPCVTSQRQDRHLHLIHLRNCMITTETRHTWQHILFSDEYQFSLRFSNGRYRVYQRRREHFTNQCVYESNRFGGGSVMVWTGICHDGRTQLKIVKEHCML